MVKILSASLVVKDEEFDALLAVVVFRRFRVELIGFITVALPVFDSFPVKSVIFLSERSQSLLVSFDI